MVFYLSHFNVTWLYSMECSSPFLGSALTLKKDTHQIIFGRGTVPHFLPPLGTNTNKILWETCKHRCPITPQYASVHLFFRLQPGHEYQRPEQRLMELCASKIKAAEFIFMTKESEEDPEEQEDLKMLEILEEQEKLPGYPSVSIDNF
ncbi:hypothetical protein RIF29_39268 [Crotalaria pallida]|uniref:Uncharacterized protein n=1 Tax=Crotalaria pallida TaxID=3830 RepID=A0AAN9E1R7_CROPI